MRTLALLVTTLIVSLLVACGTQPTGSGHVDVLLTDAPASEADHLYVDFGRIELVPSEDEEGIRTVTEEAGRFDVLTLRNGTLADLGDLDLPAGSYAQIRVIVDEATVQFGDDTYPVTVPSGAQTGLKIAIDPPLVVEADTTRQVTLDFDATRAVIETPPGSGNYLLKPTGIRAVSDVGSLEGVVVADGSGEAIEGATVTVLEDGTGEVVTSARTDADGSFRIVTLVEGTYDVELSADGYLTAARDDVAIATDTATDLGTVGLEAEATPATF